MRYLYYTLFFVLLFTRCQSDTKSEGEALAKKNCASCHKFPDPSLLDKKTWKEGVLPEMSLRLGLGDRFELLTRISEEQYKSAIQMDIYPSIAKLSHS
jgi:mono/diheme cytochrome c family protein